MHVGGAADTHSNTHRASNFSYFSVKKISIVNYFTAQRKVQEMSQGKLKTVTQVTHSFSPENSCNPEIFHVFITISLVITLVITISLVNEIGSGLNSSFNILKCKIATFPVVCISNTREINLKS